VLTSEDEKAHAHLSVKPNYRELGPRLGSRMREIAEAIEALDENAVTALIDGDMVELAGEQIGVGDVVITREPIAGIVVAAAERLSVALDTALTPELEREGLGREIVKMIQSLRRDAGFDVSDRIRLTWDSTSSQIISAMDAHGDWIAAEVLAVAVERGAGERKITVESQPMTVTVTRAGGRKG